MEDHEPSQEICLSPRDFNLKMLPFLAKLETATFSHQILAPCHMGNPPSVFMLTNYYSHPFTTEQHQTIPHSWECTLTRRKYRREEEMVTRKPRLKYFNTPQKLTRSIGVWWEDCSLSLPFAKEKKRGEWLNLLNERWSFQKLQDITLDFFSSNMSGHRIRDLNGLRGGI